MFIHGPYMERAAYQWYFSVLRVCPRGPFERRAIQTNSDDLISRSNSSVEC